MARKTYRKKSTARRAAKRRGGTIYKVRKGYRIAR